MADALLGRQVRCFSCGHRFVAQPDPAPPPPAVRVPPRPPVEEEPGEAPGLPFCPGCGKRIAWEVLRCPYCREELEPEHKPRRPRRGGGAHVRRDSEPHRGKLIATLGNASMFLGGLSLCLFGVGAVVSIPLGIAAWVLANNDLERMREGAMDVAGRAQTEAGRTGAIIGIVLSLLFAGFFALTYFRL